VDPAEGTGEEVVSSSGQRVAPCKLTLDVPEWRENDG